ncbi:MAG: DNA-directed RNA polymerase subunit beta [Bdellovibrionales bacterium]|nr:DNA-directed RNA polymerase subunit beta [Bdellovibrionales bacterium]
MKKESLTGSKLRLRASFGTIKKPLEVPNLIQLQKNSYDKFLQRNIPPEKRKNTGLQAIFKSIFPISDYNGSMSLEFDKYKLFPPKYDVRECLQKRGMTYASPLKVTFRLIIFDKNEDKTKKTVHDIKDIKEQEVYFSDIPLMTDHASFVINGTERVVVSQIHRSPGIFFDHDSGKNSPVGNYIYSVRFIPYRGSWLDFEFDQKDALYAKIDRKKKFKLILFLMALDLSELEILEEFHHIDEITIKKDKILRSFNIEKMEGWRIPSDIKDKNGKVLFSSGRRVTKSVIKKVLASGIKEVEVEEKELESEEVRKCVLAEHLFDRKTGEISYVCNSDLTRDVINEAKRLKVEKLKVIFFDPRFSGPYISDSLKEVTKPVYNGHCKKICSPYEEEGIYKRTKKYSSEREGNIAKKDIYVTMKPGEVPVKEAADYYFKNTFFEKNMYDLGEVGRIKINQRFGLDIPVEEGTLTKKDILCVLKHLIDLKNGKGKVDDIDHLGNRRVRSVGELLENQYRIGMARMERIIKERMSLQDKDTVMPQDLINAKSVSSIVKEFFGSSQLSQFMDQTNPLSEITHKRRISTFGPGGLTRERAGFEVRDVHPTHYGRICPIETPEGPNIGLIASMATFARINPYGFIETPYRVVKNGKVTDEVKYLSALEEKPYIISQARFNFDEMSQNSFLTVREDGEYKTVKKEKVDLMDVSPGQLVSIAAALIPFLEHDDANRALMGSNMQRQAVPLMIPRAPFVGTGMEKLVAQDSGNNVICKYDGIVEDISANRIIVRRFNKSGKPGSSVDVYDLIKYQRTNQNTCFNQKPIVHLGDHLKKGDVIADGLAMDRGELALGKNVLVAFTPWVGYNFEDSILISEKLIKKDVYTSIHIEEFECLARDTKLGREEITADIPNVGEETLKDLDSSGIVRIGSKVKTRDILVGKVTPKAESQMSPEKKLVLAIFGEKAGDVKDTSLRVPSGVSGIVIDTQIYTREGIEKGERLQGIIKDKKAKLIKDKETQLKALRNNTLGQIKDLVLGEMSTDVLLNDDGSKELLKKNHKITEKDIETIPFDLLAYIPLKNEISEELRQITEEYQNYMESLETIYKEKIDRLSDGEELMPGVVKMIKVYIAVKRKAEVGDKFSGRHGNKGVISKILPEEDMPYMADGRPVDMVLNPLGVPSRMNIGQILETHLGWAALNLGQQIQKYIDDFKEEKAKEDLKKIYLRDEKIVDLIEKADSKSIRQLVEKASHGIHLATPVFDGAKEEDVKKVLEHAQLPVSGQTVLFDGRTGIPFEMPVTVGVMYMLKLHHLVEEKIHARSIGPYSLVSQQPLGGKSQFGGQRLGEMEVWAIEAYGAAYCLQEFLTVKSDDVSGRVRMYESILKGENTLEAGIPESFNVLINEMKALGLNVEMFESDVLTDKVEDEDLEEEEL